MPARLLPLSFLQNKRRKFSSKRCQTRSNTDTDQVCVCVCVCVCCVQVHLLTRCSSLQPPPADLTSGLVGGSQENLVSPDNGDTPLDNPLAPSNPPVDLEDRQAFSSEQAPVHSRSLSTKLRKFRPKKPSPGITRRPLNKTPLKEEAEPMVNGNSPGEEGQSAVNSEPSQPQESKPFRKSM